MKLLVQKLKTLDNEKNNNEKYNSGRTIMKNNSSENTNVLY